LAGLYLQLLLKLSDARHVTSTLYQPQMTFTTNLAFIVNVDARGAR